MFYFVKNYFEYHKTALIQHQASNGDDIFEMADICNDSPWHNSGPKMSRNCRRIDIYGCSARALHRAVEF